VVGEADGHESQEDEEDAEPANWGPGNRWKIFSPKASEKEMAMVKYFYLT
jgi:hypothetical protein